MKQSDSPKRILILAPFPPHLDALHGGGRVIAQFVSRLAQKHHIALLCLRGPDDPCIDPRLSAACASTKEVARREFKGVITSGVRLLTSALAGRPKWATLWNSAEFAACVRAAAAEWKPDVIQAEFHVMSQYFRVLEPDGPVRVLVEHEVGSAAAAERYRSASPTMRPLLALNLLAWRRFECMAVKAAHRVVVFTDRDRQALEALGAAGKTRMIAFGPTIAPIPARASIGREILFFGNFIHQPNIDAALRLMRDIFPAVLARLPSTRLHVVGDQPTSEMREAAGPNIVLTGRVPDVQPFLLSSTLVVIPIRSGGGMRVKVLDALAAGKPVIASSRALEGISVSEGQEVMVAETDQEFCDTIVRVLEDSRLRDSLAHNAAEWISRHTGWEQCIASYESLYDEVLGCSKQA